MKRALLIAFHYPPLCGSSGLQRTYRFAQYLRDFDWQPVVLTITSKAYESTSDDYPDLEGIPVCRAFGLDSARQLSLLGRYPACIARPDRWASWYLGGTVAGIGLIRKYRPSILWSTYPIATAHLIGHALARYSKLPWVADFRDPMAHDGYPDDARTWASFERVERKVFSAASAVTFTTGGAARLYRQRYPHTKAGFHLIENGYDEDAFTMAEARVQRISEVQGGAIVLLHSGVVYPQWRNPQLLFRALRRLLNAKHERAAQVVIRFRAPVHDDLVMQSAIEEGVADHVEIAGEVNYIDALAEMLSVQGLLLLQNAECNDQVPAKLYEYLRAGQPILALTDPEGESAKALKGYGRCYVGDLASEQRVGDALMSWLQEYSDTPRLAGNDPMVRSCSRQGRTRQLADVFNSLTE